ncbi:MAG: phosphoribosyl-ATP diphosphatase, partial [Sulfurovum sp. FS08-3]
GAKSCFFTSVNKENILYNNTLDTIAIYGIVDTLYHTILSRKSDNSSNSWTKKLLNDKSLLLSKIREEADELAVAIDKEEDKQVIYEASDLLYHALVGLAYRDVSPDRIKQELARRFGTSGISEKATRSQ